MNALLGQLVNMSPVVLFRRNVDDVVTYIGPNVQRVLGYAPSEIVGRRGFWTSHVHPDDRAPFRAQMRAALTSRARDLERDYRFLHKDERYRWLHARTE